MAGLKTKPSIPGRRVGRKKRAQEDGCCTLGGGGGTGKGAGGADIWEKWLSRDWSVALDKKGALEGADGGGGPLGWLGKSGEGGPFGGNFSGDRHEIWRARLRAVANFRIFLGGPSGMYWDRFSWLLDPSGRDDGMCMAGMGRGRGRLDLNMARGREIGRGGTYEKGFAGGLAGEEKKTFWRKNLKGGGQTIGSYRRGLGRGHGGGGAARWGRHE